MPSSSTLKTSGSINRLVGSHSSHVLYARDLCETRIYAANTSAENSVKAEIGVSPNTQIILCLAPPFSTLELLWLALFLTLH